MWQNGRKLNVAKMASKLMCRGVYEAEDGLEGVLVESFTDLQPQLSPPYNLAIPSPQQYQRLIQALLYAILTQQHQAQTLVTHLKAIVTDGYASFVHLLTSLVHQSYPRLLDQTKRQLIWIFRQLAELHATDAETLCLSLLRRIAGGDLTQPNLWLALELVHILQGNWGWVTANQGLLTGALFSYLRLLPDHCKGKGDFFSVLKKNEIEFCVRVLRERFQDCICIGRDLVRLLQDLACVPEFELIWKDLLGNPGVFRVSGFMDVSQLYLTRTPVRYLVSRVTPEMETQIRFMLTHVKWGSQRRYQAWFANKFFAAPESETLICDLIRFICCAHHPPNEILQSDIISRWAIIGWLLKCCRSNYVEANAKLSLFYDWLFFRNQTDNIMNIEPAILLMVHSIPKYIDITQSLLEFLFLLMENYDLNRRELIHRGVSASFEILIGKGVVRSLEPLLSCNNILPSLREKLATCSIATNSTIDCSIAEITGKKTTEVATNSRVDYRIAEIIGKKTTEVTTSSKVDYRIAEITGKKTTEVATINSRKPAVFRLQKLGQSSVSTVCPKGNQSHVTELQNKDPCDMKLDAAGTEQSKRLREDDVDDTVQQKRVRLEDVAISGQQQIKCVDDVSGTVQQKKMAFDNSKKLSLNNLLETLKRSDTITINMLDKILMLYLGISEQEGDDPVEEHGLPNVSQDSSPEFAGDLARWIVNVVKVCGHEMFSPLMHPPDGLERDEIMSATSVVLRIYTLYQHPKLQEMLLFWHKNGLAVGPRLLCYASRLANELERILGMKHIMDGYSLNQNLNGLDVLSTDAIEEECGLTDRNKDAITGRSLLMWQAEKYSLSARAREASSCCIQCIENVGMKQFFIMVEEAFRAYKQFLAFTNTSASSPPVLDSNQSRMLLAESSDGRLTKHELNINQNVISAFLKDLRILCLWSVSRSQQVFTSIFRYLSDLSSGKEGVIQLLVCFLVPAEILRFEIKLSLKEFSVFGEDPQTICTLMKSSVDWDATEQQCFWRLLISELQVCEVPCVMTLLIFCADSLDPLVHAGTISGFLTFLRSQTPSTQLLNAILCLPKRFTNFAASVIASWLVSKRSALIPSLADWSNVCLDSIQGTNEMNKFSTEKLNLSAIKALIHFLDRHDMNESMGSKSSPTSHFSEIKATLSKVVGNIGFRETAVKNRRTNVEVHKGIQT